MKASTALRCDTLTLIAMTPTRDIVVEGKSIHVCSAIDWLLKIER